MNSKLLIPGKYMIMSREVLSFELGVGYLCVACDSVPGSLALLSAKMSRISCRRGTGTSTALHSCSKSVCLFQLWTRYSV